MVERAARQICQDQGLDPDVLVVRNRHTQFTRTGHVVVGNTMPAWQIYAGMVHGVIESMREPTDAVMNAFRCASREEWAAAIDAALSPGE
jgi:hypothetical protein